MFYRCKTFTLTWHHFLVDGMVPNGSGILFPIHHPQEEKDIHDTLHACFEPTTLWSRLTSSKTGLREAPYHSNLVARQFGLSQMLPKCFILKGKTFFFSIDNATKKWLAGFHEFCKRKAGFLGSLDYSLSCHFT